MPGCCAVAMPCDRGTPASFPSFSSVLELMLRRYQNSQAAVFDSQPFNRIPPVAALPFLIPQFKLFLLLLSERSPSPTTWPSSLTSALSCSPRRNTSGIYQRILKAANFQFPCDDYSASFFTSQIF